jgi:toxin secretion/phage lysis holin
MTPNKVFLFWRKEGARMEQFIKLTIALSGAAVTFMFGGWSVLLKALLFFVVLDYITGLTAGYFEGKLSSKTGMKGIAKKVLIFIIVTIAHQVDLVMGDGHFFRDATVLFYITNELISILENSGRIGLPVPSVIRKAVEVLKDKGDKR